MSADELLKEEGYELVGEYRDDEGNLEILDYEYKWEGNPKNIEFYFENERRYPYVRFYHEIGREADVYMSLIIAVNEKLRELGWLE